MKMMKTINTHIEKLMCFRNDINFLTDAYKEIAEDKERIENILDKKNIDIDKLLAHINILEEIVVDENTKSPSLSDDADKIRDKRGENK